jgi:dCTP deaminase
VGKSTYARCGIIVNVTPIEPGWQGYITVEISNTYWKDARVYANEGIMQLMFISAGKRPLRTYCDKNGKYQNQPFEPVIPRM